MSNFYATQVKKSQNFSSPINIKTKYNNKNRIIFKIYILFLLLVAYIGKKMMMK